MIVSLEIVLILMEISPFLIDSTDKGYSNLEVFSHLNIIQPRWKQIWMHSSLTFTKLLAGMKTNSSSDSSY